MTDKILVEGGQESPLSLVFLDRLAEIEMHTHRLPHWQQGDVCLFVTWRLADSIPYSMANTLRKEKDDWMRLHPRPHDAATEKQYHIRFSQRMDQWLDQGMGSCVLRNPKCSAIVANALLHFNGQRYDMLAFVVMPNHVHVLFQLRSPNRLEEVLKSWKGFTARTINNVFGRHGALWQDDYWDRLIRSDAHLRRCIQYIRENPEKARLRPDEFVLYERTPI